MLCAVKNGNVFTNIGTSLLIIITIIVVIILRMSKSVGQLLVYIIYHNKQK
jgi:hypothetical protein